MICLAPLILVLVLFGEYKRSSLIYRTGVQVHPTTDGSQIPHPREPVSNAVDVASATEGWLGRRWPKRAIVSLSWYPDDAARVRSGLGPAESLRVQSTTSETSTETKWVQREDGTLELLIKLERPEGFRQRSQFSLKVVSDRGASITVDCKVTVRNYIYLRFKDFTMSHVSWE